MKILLMVLLGLVLFVMGIITHILSVQYSNQKKLKIINKFNTAWNAHDIDMLMSLMAEEPTFFTSSGSHAYGNKYVGQKAVRQAFLEVMHTYSTGKWESAGKAYISGCNATAPFLFRNKKDNGSDFTVYGVDLFVFQGDKILIKDGYRKF